MMSNGANKKWIYSACVLGSVWDYGKNYPAFTSDNAFGHVIIRNVTVEGGDPEKNYIGNPNKPQGSSGGIVGGGTSDVRGFLILNCTVKNIDIYENYAGGIMGEDTDAGGGQGKCNTGARIYGCKVIGELKNNIPQYSIIGNYTAGGVYGDIADYRYNNNPKYKSIVEGDTTYKEYTADIDGVSVYVYNICCRNPDNSNTTSYAAGGITGIAKSERYIQNCKVEKCIIDVGCPSSSASNVVVSGAVGRMESDCIIKGYNIEVKNCDFLTHQWMDGAATNAQKAYTYTDENDVVHNPVSGVKCGNVVGNGTTTQETNITAIHVENCPAEEDFNSVKSSSFIVYADYNDAASSSDKGTEMSTLSVLPSSYTNIGEGGLKDYFPNVNVSPVI